MSTDTCPSCKRNIRTGPSGERLVHHTGDAVTICVGGLQLSGRLTALVDNVPAWLGWDAGWPPPEDMLVITSPVLGETVWMTPPEQGSSGHDDLLIGVASCSWVLRHARLQSYEVLSTVAKLTDPYLLPTADYKLVGSWMI